jgi:hypothetical protein
MKVYELLKKSSKSKILGLISYHYGNKEYEDFVKLIDVLGNFELKPTEESDFTVYIRISDMDTDDILELNGKTNEYDSKIYYDVSALKNGSDEVYSISADGYNSFLQYEVEAKTLENLSYESIMAHLLYEITSYGFEDFGEDKN